MSKGTACEREHSPWGEREKSRTDPSMGPVCFCLSTHVPKPERKQLGQSRGWPSSDALVSPSLEAWRVSFTKAAGRGWYLKPQAQQPSLHHTRKNERSSDVSREPSCPSSWPCPASRAVVASKRAAIMDRTGSWRGGESQGNCQTAARFSQGNCLSPRGPKKK